MTLLMDELRECGDWFNALTEQHERLDRIDHYLQEREKTNPVYPLRGARLNALRHTPLNGVKCVLLAQDPYPGVEGTIPKAMGLALSVNPGVKPPASLKNMYKELERDQLASPVGHGDLRDWAREGVLLWNVLLTLDAGESKSHKKSEWPAFTEAILRAVIAKNPHVVFLSFGRDSHASAPLFESSGCAVVKTSHPSPLGATKSAKDGSFPAFMGSGCFRKTNELLNKQSIKPINWQLPNNPL